MDMGRSWDLHLLTILPIGAPGQLEESGLQAFLKAKKKSVDLIFGGGDVP